MTDAYVVGAVRAPVGRRGGGLPRSTPPTSGRRARALVERTGVDPGEIDDVLWGCVGQMGPQASNIGRTTVLSAGLPGDGARRDHRPAVRLVAAGAALRRAGGDGRRAGPRRRRRRRGMSQVPIGSPTTIGLEHGMAHPRGGNGWAERFGDQEISQFRGAELIAEKWGLSREEMERFALESHARALRATDGGLFDEEIVAGGGARARRGAAARAPRPRSWPR